MKALLILCLLVNIFGCSNKQPTLRTGLEGKPMPSFNLLLTDSITRINSKIMAPGKPIVLFYFSPECPYCRSQTEEIINNINSLNNIQFCMLSNFPINQIKQYYNHYQLNKYRNITVAQDYDSHFSIFFKTTIVPYFAIYSREKKLLNVNIGKLEFQQLKDISIN
jgi:thiol-disulfide isomerase/thioredoxin